MTSTLTAEQLEIEIRKIAQYIAEAKLEILAIARPAEQTGNDKNLTNAAMELTEVVRHTEEATNSIMDRADAIIVIAGGMADTAIGAKLSDEAVGILEACSFQDITGQRIKKVMSTLEQIELRVGRLVKLLGGDIPDSIKVAAIDTGNRRADEDLCNGPQLGKNKPSQDDVDKLFSSQ